MSVVVEQISKRFGDQLAVNELSFKAVPGTITGFLGPNGAGKTTTMKMLTGYLKPSSGTAKICGLDILEDSMETRKRIGYLPEHNPLYKDMYVREYLRFVAGIHHITNAKSRIDELIEITGLELEQKKKISALSKGYRQRVGLAQSIMHDPDVLILDEPTSGLDPNQLKEIRALIRKLGKEKTLIFSSHILQEVQALCDSVLIIHRGKLVANDSIDKLQSLIKKERVIRIEIEQKVDENLLRKIDGVNDIRKLDDHNFELTCTTNDTNRRNIFNYAVKNNLVLLTLTEQTNSIEDVFEILTSSNS
jgi:ABC-2 type transport system ATP-binding protein